MKGVPIWNVTYKRFLSTKEAATYLGYDTAKEFTVAHPHIKPVLRSGKWKYDVEQLDSADTPESFKSKQQENALSRL